jgi:heme exporter protein C
MSDYQLRKYGVLIPIFIVNLVSIYLTFLYAPPEATLGDAYRVFYFHVPSAWVSYLAFGVTLLGSIMFLVKKSYKWDMVAEASSKLGLIFCSVALLSGSIWANLTWGSYWTWDPRETTTLILLLTYIAYLSFRMAIDDREKKARLSSVLGVLGFITVPLSYVSVQLMTLHPGGGAPLSKLNLTSPMMMTLMVALLGVTLIYLSLLKRTYDLMKMEDKLSEMRYQGGDFR